MWDTPSRTKKPAKFQIVMIRCGLADWDDKKMVIGWHNSELTKRGEDQAKRAANFLKEAGFTFDMAYCSVLRRGKQSLHVILDNIQQRKIPIEYSWTLNQRQFGAFTGMKIEDIRKNKVQEFKDFTYVPPNLYPDNPIYKDIFRDPAYDPPPFVNVPQSESLNDCIARVVPYWQNTIVPKIKNGRFLLIMAHRDSLRCLIKHIDHLSERETLTVPVPRCLPILYTFDEDVVPVQDGSMKFIAEEDVVDIEIKRTKNDFPP